MCSDGHVSYHLARGPYVSYEGECCTTFNVLRDKLFSCVELVCYGVHDCVTFVNSAAWLKELNHLFETFTMLTGLMSSAMRSAILLIMSLFHLLVRWDSCQEFAESMSAMSCTVYSGCK